MGQFSEHFHHITVGFNAIGSGRFDQAVEFGTGVAHM